MREDKNIFANRFCKWRVSEKPHWVVGARLLEDQLYLSFGKEFWKKKMVSQVCNPHSLQFTCLWKIQRKHSKEHEILKLLWDRLLMITEIWPRLSYSTETHWKSLYSHLQSICLWIFVCFIWNEHTFSKFYWIVLFAAILLLHRITAYHKLGTTFLICS